MGKNGAKVVAHSVIHVSMAYTQFLVKVYSTQVKTLKTLVQTLTFYQKCLKTNCQIIFLFITISIHEIKIHICKKIKHNRNTKEREIKSDKQ